MHSGISRGSGGHWFVCSVIGTDAMRGGWQIWIIAYQANHCAISTTIRHIRV